MDTVYFDIKISFRTNVELEEDKASLLYWKITGERKEYKDLTAAEKQTIADWIGYEYSNGFECNDEALGNYDDWLYEYCEAVAKEIV